MGFFPFNSGSTLPIPWLPSDNGLLVASSDALDVPNTTTLTAGTVYLVKLPVRTPTLISNLWYSISNAGVGASTGSFAGLYSPSGGAPLSGSADIGASLLSGGNLIVPLTTPQLIQGGNNVSAWPWAGIVVNLATTQPTMVRGSGNVAPVNANQTASNFRVCVNGTGQTSLPTITPSSNVTANASSLWVGAT